MTSRTKKAKTKTITVTVKAGQAVQIVSAVSASTDVRRPYFLKWVDSCSNIPVDHWRPARKNQKAKFSEPIPISSMHTMQLVNAIKWCMRSAMAAMAHSPYYYIDWTPASLLAMSPQWAYLLQEAKVRQLRIVGHELYDYNMGGLVGFEYSKWFEEAFKAVAFKKLEE